jgi:hypothetical protein
MKIKNAKDIKCVIFDFANTLSSSHYFQTNPPQCPNWRKLFEEHVFSVKEKLTSWCTGNLSAIEIAKEIQPFSKMPLETMISEMHAGCKNIVFNNEVMQFAKNQHKHNRKTALVTVNIDLFSEIISPFFGFNNLFDVVINSADFKTDDKETLWQTAFNQLKNDISYNNTLLIDDSEKWVSIFLKNNGNAFQYAIDSKFREWLISEKFT